MRRRLAWLPLGVCALLTVALLLAPHRPLLAAPLAQSAGDPLVLAFYYTWYDENTWTYDKLSDLPAEPYASRDRGVMGRHIDQAKRAGIDALLVAWYGPGGGNQTEGNLAAMLEEAGARGYKIGVLFETNSPFFGGVGDVTAALQHLLSVHAAHPAYLRVDGRPVVFFWRPTLYGVETWRTIRAQSDPNNAAIWISEGVDTSYLAVFDGHHLYSNTWNPPADLHATNQKFASRVEQVRQQSGVYKLWVATVMPGYNDIKVRGGFARDREGGNYYAQSWQAAIASRPNWIVINSFNEWPEGSYIEPSAAFGDHYLNLTAQFSGQFKSGGGQPVQLAAVAAAAPPAPAEPTPAPDAPTAFVNAALVNLRSGPGTDFPVVGQVAAGTPLPITGSDPAQPEWWQVRHGDGEAWVFGPLVTTGGPMEQVRQVTAPLPPMTAGHSTGDLGDQAGDNGVGVSAAEAGAPLVAPTTAATMLAVPLPDSTVQPLLPYLSR
ncbi:MAG TPA: endo-1,3-alpha-glucanase family glycosylhydrolase [Caldilineaceae bacterium]|nr:endo-1,3-alpha-glucanase family glycosylhydrolase [Caldilineaceae bacterium]